MGIAFDLSYRFVLGRVERLPERRNLGYTVLG